MIHFAAQILLQAIRTLLRRLVHRLQRLVHLLLLRPLRFLCALLHGLEAILRHRLQTAQALIPAFFHLLKTLGGIALKLRQAGVCLFLLLRHVFFQAVKTHERILFVLTHLTHNELRKLIQLTAQRRRFTLHRLRTPLFRGIQALLNFPIQAIQALHHVGCGLAHFIRNSL